jgi:hypothetical protein
MEKQGGDGRVADRRNDLPIQSPRQQSRGGSPLDDIHPPRDKVQHNGGVDHIRRELAYDYHITLAHLWDDPKRDFDMNLKK